MSSGKGTRIEGNRALIDISDVISCVEGLLIHIDQCAQAYRERTHQPGISKEMRLKESRYVEWLEKNRSDFETLQKQMLAIIVANDPRGKELDMLGIWLPQLAVSPDVDAHAQNLRNALAFFNPEVSASEVMK